jgi:hypothetical protein
MIFYSDIPFNDVMLDLDHVSWSFHTHVSLTSALCSRGFPEG